MNTPPNNRVFTLVASLLLCLALSRAARAEAPDSLAAEKELLHGLATLLQENIQTGCSANLCHLLVMNFLSQGGNTSPYGIRLADELSAELAQLPQGVPLIERARLLMYQVKVSATSESLNSSDQVRRIAQELGADIFLVGNTQKMDKGEVKLSVRLLNGKGEEMGGSVQELTLRPSYADLTPSEPYYVNPSAAQSMSGEVIYRAGLNGVTMPTCFYMPNPPYTPDAKKMKFSGAVIAEAIVNLTGHIEGPRIVKGAPGGLNEETLKVMQTWRCKPSQLEGKPVPTLVPFEVTFRLY